MANGTYPFFSNALIVGWSYDPSNGQLTVSGSFDGKTMTSIVLKAGTNTGQINGSSGNQTATVSLAANFTTNVLNMSASATNPTRNGVGSSNF